MSGLQVIKYTLYKSNMYKLNKIKQYKLQVHSNGKISESYIHMWITISCIKNELEVNNKNIKCYKQSISVMNAVQKSNVNYSVERQYPLCPSLPTKFTNTIQW